MFATFRLHMVHRDVTTTGEEYRRLLEVEGGELCRFLTGPAASAEYAPRLRFEDRLYPVVSFELKDRRLKVTHPAWSGVMAIDETQAEVARRSDGLRTIGELLPRLA